MTGDCVPVCRASGLHVLALSPFFLHPESPGGGVPTRLAGRPPLRDWVGPVSGPRIPVFSISPHPRRTVGWSGRQRPVRLSQERDMDDTLLA